MISVYEEINEILKKHNLSVPYKGENNTDAFRNAS